MAREYNTDLPRAKGNNTLSLRLFFNCIPTDIPHDSSSFTFIESALLDDEVDDDVEAPDAVS